MVPPICAEGATNCMLHIWPLALQLSQLDAHHAGKYCKQVAWAVTHKLCTLATTLCVKENTSCRRNICPLAVQICQPYAHHTSVQYCVQAHELHKPLLCTLAMVAPIYAEGVINCMLILRSQIQITQFHDVCLEHTKHALQAFAATSGGCLDCNLVHGMRPGQWEHTIVGCPPACAAHGHESLCCIVPMLSE